MKKFTTLLCAIGLAATFAIKPAPANACITNCTSSAPGLMFVSLLLIAVMVATGDDDGATTSSSGDAEPETGLTPSYEGR